MRAVRWHCPPLLHGRCIRLNFGNPLVKEWCCPIADVSVIRCFFLHKLILPRFARNARYAGAADLASLNSSIIVGLNAGMSSGLRLVTRVRSTTTSWSTPSAPALRRSVLSEGHEVRRRPRAAPVSMIVQGPWQIEATGLPASRKALAKATALG